MGGDEQPRLGNKQDNQSNLQEYLGDVLDRFEITEHIEIPEHLDVLGYKNLLVTGNSAY